MADEKHLSFAERLNLALDKEGFPPKNRGRIQQLAEMVGMTHRGASKWVNGETCPPAKKYSVLAEKLNVNEFWLKTGAGDISKISEKQNMLASSNFRKIPVYTLDSLDDETRSPSTYVSCNSELNSTNLLAIKLDSQAMSPRFPANSIAIFDTQKEFVDGDFVLVKIDGLPAPIMRQILIIGSTYYLEAFNPKFERLILSRKEDALGVLVQAILSF